MALAALLFAAGMAIFGCRPKAAPENSALRATVEFDPNPPTVGTTGLAITLVDAAGQPVRLGKLDVEGDMNHAGMRPVFTQVEEGEPGRYTGSIDFSMAGDWVLLVSGQGPDGNRLETKITVPGVRPK